MFCLCERTDGWAFCSLSDAPRASVQLVPATRFKCHFRFFMLWLNRLTMNKPKGKCIFCLSVAKNTLPAVHFCLTAANLWALF